MLMWCSECWKNIFEKSTFDRSLFCPNLMIKAFESQSKHPVKQFDNPKKIGQWSTAPKNNGFWYFHSHLVYCKVNELTCVVVTIHIRTRWDVADHIKDDRLRFNTVCHSVFQKSKSQCVTQEHLVKLQNVLYKCRVVLIQGDLSRHYWNFWSANWVILRIRKLDCI